MKSTELRIGNYYKANMDFPTGSLSVKINVTEEKRDFQLTEEIARVLFSSYNNGSLNLLEFIEPIPLTEERLLKFEFENWGIVNVNEYERYERWVLFNVIDGTSNFEVHIINSNYGDIKEMQIIYSIDSDERMHHIKNTEYVHTLQNTYALTGGELTLIK